MTLKNIKKRNIAILLLLFFIFASLTLVVFFMSKKAIYFLRVRNFSVTVISDIHLGTSLCDWKQCGERVENSLREVLSLSGDNLIVSVGDNVDASEYYADQEKATALRGEYKAKLLEIVGDRKILWANGNHDRETYLSGKEYYSWDENNWRFIIIHTTDVEGDQYAWLIEQLKTEKNKIIVMHHPVFKQGKKDIVTGYQPLVELFRDNNVKYVLSGHWHADKYERNLDGVVYKAIQGLTVYGKTHNETLNLEYRKIDTEKLPPYQEKFFRRLSQFDLFKSFLEKNYSMK